jgi:hypothetical protein
LTAVHPVSADPPAPSPITIPGVELFARDLADVLWQTGIPEIRLQDVVRIAKRNAHCYPPRVTVKVGMKRGGDPVFLNTIARARLMALDQALKLLRLKEDQINNYTTMPFEAALNSVWYQATVPQIDINAVPDEYVQISFDPPFNMDDKDPPMLLYVGSWPNPGTPVKPGQQITIKIRSSERYDDGHKSWPGEYRLRLWANEGPNGSGVAVNEFLPMDPCDRTTVTTLFYTVPAYPHDTVHLRVTVENRKGQYSSREADYPILTEKAGSGKKKTTGCKGNTSGGECLQP